MRITQAKRYCATQGSGQPEAETIDVLLRLNKSPPLYRRGLFAFQISAFPGLAADRNHAPAAFLFEVFDVIPMPAILGGSWPLCRRIHRIDGRRRLFPGMNPLHYRDMIIRAIEAGDMRRIDQLAAQLEQAEEARRLLQALTHCPACAASAVAGLAPEVPST